MPSARMRIGAFIAWLVVSSVVVDAQEVSSPDPPRESSRDLGAGEGRRAGQEWDSLPLASGALRELAWGVGASGAEAQDPLVIVEVLHDLSRSEADALVVAHGGSVLEGVGDLLVLASIPLGSLAALEAEPGIRYLRLPLEAGVDEPPQLSLHSSSRGAMALYDHLQGALRTGEEVDESSANGWHAEGITGHGIRIGIIDRFNSQVWNPAESMGEVPTPIATNCVNNGVSCVATFWSQMDGGNPERHGTAVAEIIHEMAPDAELYLASATSAADFVVIDAWFAAHQVDIVSISLGFPFDGPGDGTGPIDTALAGIAANPALVVKSGGNDAESYWRGSWADGDGDGWLNFTPGDEVLDFRCGFIKGVRWDDWGETDPTDFDVYLSDDGTWSGTVVGDDRQGSGVGEGADPVEHFGCDGADVDGDGLVLLAIQRVDANNGGTDTIEFLGGSGLEYGSAPFSAAAPIADMNNARVLAVGAIDPPSGMSIASYSSRGPTNDFRIKPDISASACVKSFSYRPACFNGTSSAAPAVSGAAALIMSTGLYSDPSEVKDWLETIAYDRGQTGDDNEFGAGELFLGSPPPWSNNEFAQALPTNSMFGVLPTTTSSANKQSPEPSHAGNAGGASLWFDFMAPQTSAVQFTTFGSSFDTLLAVYTGDQPGALTEVASDDDNNWCACRQSVVQFAATAGQLYHIAVDGYGGLAGALILNWGMNASVQRWAGPNRFATAVEISKANFGPGVEVAYIATAGNFPDALALGGLRGGPVLLTNQWELHSQTAAELARLQPKKIVLVGSEAVVGQAVADAAAGYTVGPVERWGGANRFETAAIISQNNFAPGVPVAYIAYAYNFPDALALGGLRDGPVLLTDQSSLHGVTAAELVRLQPEKIVVVGSSAVVSDHVVDQLGAYTGGAVLRWGGANRFETAAIISQNSFDPGVPVVYIAYAYNFPDALALGGLQGGPVLLTDVDALHGATRSELERLDPVAIVVVGSSSVVSYAVEAELPAYFGPIPVAD